MQHKLAEDTFWLDCKSIDFSPINCGYFLNKSDLEIAFIFQDMDTGFLKHPKLNDQTQVCYSPILENQV
jgi:hypothetical protein